MNASAPGDPAAAPIAAPQRARFAAGREPLRIGDRVVRPGTAARLELPVARLFTGNWLSLPVSVLHGARPGPCLWLSAAIHGDELNGMEIIRRILAHLEPASLQGAVIAVPVVNVFGFVQQTRYLPDRRDLNRSFPGSSRGSTAARLAHLLMDAVVSKCGYGIDFHTGSQHRSNLPQIRAHLADPETHRIAEAFRAPMMYSASEIAGSLRAAARRQGAHVIVYEAGEPLRFDQEAIRVGVAGVLRVLAALDMWPAAEQEEQPAPSFEAGETRWLRAPRSGIFHLAAGLGEWVRRHQQLGAIAGPFSTQVQAVKAPFEGLVIGFTANPLVHRGDALLHLAKKAGGRGAPA
ncbi:MAG TPA: succinylglutamate desuccinylase/aspartoacylase family protein [Thermoanaerobaculia bacterium]|nr:succinylglutamate desuccinylase/aspartoacylase family protein [Thermoanaerobaculia bacterium]